jgi:AraC-like DNA-binding protein
MAGARLRTTDLPVEHRFATWAELAVRSHVPVAIDSNHRSDFKASMEVHDFGTAAVSRMSYPPVRARRTASMVRDNDPGVLLVCHVARGSMTMRWDDRAGTAPAGHLIATDTSRPSVATNRVDIRSTVLQLPTSMLGLRRPEVEAMMVRPMTTGHGIGGLLAYIMRDLARHGGTHEPAVVAHLTAAAVDLLATAARRAHGSAHSLPASSRDGLRRLQVYVYMRLRLAEPTLTPESVADAQGISVRQLNRILEADGTSPSDWIRRQRLDRCRRDLIDPAQFSRPVAAIGSRWGFADPVTFSRAFRRQFGVPPGEYRRHFARTAPTSE